MANEQAGTSKDKVAIITGASRGLGRNTAVNLARRGVDLILTYHSIREKLRLSLREAEAMGRKATGFRLDTGDVRSFDGFVADVRKAPQRWGTRSV
jgi:NAD(P)-dependent dehydrogenase (short-subunit alcohol dehydrogenase family)